MKKENKEKNKPESKPQSKKLIEQTVRQLVESEISNLGYELWDVEYYNDGAEWLLDITIDRPGAGISLDDCEKATRAVNPLIDAADPIENSYSLAVSSPGLNRGLKTDLHFNKYLDKEVTVKLFAKNETTGEKVFKAVLKGFSADGFTFEINQNGAPAPLALGKKEIARLCAYDEINF